MIRGGGGGVIRGHVLFDAEIADDEFLTFRGIFAHVEGEEVAGGVGVVGADGVEAHVRADEVFEFRGVDFAEAFESSDFGCFAAFGDGFEPFFFCVAVERFLFVADAEERRLEDEEVAAADDVGEELEEEGDEFLKKVMNKFAYFVSFWYSGRASKQEDFKIIEDYLNVEDKPTETDGNSVDKS